MKTKNVSSNLANLNSLTPIELNCDFDNSFCGYIPNSNFIRYTGPSPSKSSGEWTHNNITFIILYS
jgi:hypothetical protein